MAELMRVDVVDNAGPWLQWVLDTHAEWQRKALKSTGDYARAEIKKGIKSGAPGGRKYVKNQSALSRDLMSSRAVNKPAKLSKRAERHKTRRGHQILGRLGGAVRYEYENGIVRVGWLAEWAVRLGKRAESGETETVTGKMRGLYAAGAEGLKKSTTQIKIPARPTFGPMYSYLAPKLGPYFLGKIEEYLANGGPPAKRIGKGRS